MKAAPNEHIGTWISVLRKFLGLKQTELALISGISRASLIKIENGQMPLSQEYEGKLRSILRPTDQFWETGHGTLLIDGEDAARERILNMVIAAKNRETAKQPWEDEAYKVKDKLIKHLESEIAGLRQTISYLSSGKINFLKPRNGAAIVPLKVKEAAVIALRGKAAANG